ncbi:RagB/SusD family nutrient uptake outer membrane protein [Flavicella marina]|uniref:RagB/SusD family nutrient uptake outer membrane protein n=1 Tax=Flavicella marina TaxID=1475951 RepID=UPI0012659761|nr:RagB/SusD family nutrient uptake outer membrane protein [Flavicella marina]
MKYLYIIVFVCTQFLVSCDEILDVSDDLAELGALNKELLYSSEENIESVVNGVYAKYASEFYNGGNFYQMTSAHTPYFSSSGAKGLEYGKFDISSSSKSLNDTWVEIYSCVDHTNHLIENLNLLAPNFSTTPRNLGQAYFIRAITYFDLVRVWGEVPLRTVPAEQATLFLPKSSKQEIYDQIIADLTKATELLPEQEYIVGRPLSYAAYGYLAKVYMQMATETTLSGTAEQYWDLAYQNAKEVFDNGPYSLVPSYEDLFAEGNENTSESIFEIQYTATGTSTKSGQHSTTTAPAKSIYNRRANGGNLRVNRLALHDHYLDYNIGITDTHPDPRRTVSYVSEEYTEIIAPFKKRKIYPVQFSGGFAVNWLKKYQEVENTNINSSRNRMIFRYADLLLMLAEIENERGNYQPAKDYVKLVLDRANTTLYDLSGIQSLVGGDDLRQRILVERVYELLGEGHEWFDMRRQTVGGVSLLENRILRRQALMTGDDLFDTKNKTNFHETWNPDLSHVTGDNLIKNMRFPIPDNEIVGNNALTNSDQNEGY